MIRLTVFGKPLHRIAIFGLAAAVLAAMACERKGGRILGQKGKPAESEQATQVPPDDMERRVEEGAPDLVEGDEQVSPQPKYVEGEITVKFKEMVTPRAAPSRGRVIVRTGLASIDSLNERLGILEMEKIFKDGGRSAKKAPPSVTQEAVEVSDSSRLYRIRFPRELDAREIAEEYRKDPNVEYAEPRYVPVPDLSPNDTHFGKQWGVEKIRTPDAWNVHQGDSRIIVAVIDTGVDWKHEDLRDKIWINSRDPIDGRDNDGNGYIDDYRGWDFSANDNDPNYDPAYEKGYHGTHVAGIVAASTNNELGVAGVCWHCKIMAIRYGDVVREFRYAVDNGAKVLSNSWGYPGLPYCPEDVAEAIRYANEKGALVVFSAGNENKGVLRFPAACHGVVAVANTDKTDAKAGTSNFGAWVDVSAPGTGILSTFIRPISYYGGPYVTLSGTSMAAPMVSGLAALVLSGNPKLTNLQVGTILKGSTDTIDSANPTYKGLLGTGRINAYKAMTTRVSVPSAYLVSDSSRAGQGRFSYFAYNQREKGWSAIGVRTSKDTYQLTLGRDKNCLIQGSQEVITRIQTGYYAAGHGFIVRDFKEKPTGVHCLAVESASNDAEPYQVEWDEQGKDLALNSSNGPFAMGQSEVLDVYGVTLLEKAPYEFKLSFGAGKCDLGMGLFDRSTEGYSNLKHALVATDSGGNGQGESFTLGTDWPRKRYGLVVWNKGCTTPTASYTISVWERTPPSAAIGLPIAHSWQGQDFLVSVTDSDTGGSGLRSCQYRVLSGGSETRPWTSRTCNSGFTVSVGLGKDCSHQGALGCEVQVKATDHADNSAGDSRQFNIDFSSPTVAIPDVPPTWQNMPAQAQVACDDRDGGGCDAASYRLREQVGSCSQQYSDYGLMPPHTVSSHKWYCAAAKDFVGNVGVTPTALEFRIDVVLPDTLISKKPPSPTSQTTAAFEFTSTKAMSSFLCRLDSGAEAVCVSPQSYTRLSDGTHTFYVRAVDIAGNVDPSPASFTWRVKTTPPDTTISKKPSALSNQLSATFEFTSNEAGSTFQCRVDAGGFSACTSPKTYAALSEGQHTFYVKAIDSVGNEDPTPATYGWTVDQTPPETTLTDLPPSMTNQIWAGFMFTSSDSSATFECELDGVGFSGCASPKSYSPLKEGPHTFTVRARDPAGNIDPTPAAHTWTVDSTPPGTPNSSLMTVTMKPTGAQDQLSGSPGAVEGKATVRVYSDGLLANFIGSGLATGDGSLATVLIGDNLGDASDLVYVVAVDTAGNQSPPANKHNDKTPPKTTITARPPAFSGQASVTFEFSSNEGGSTFACKLDQPGTPGNFGGCTSPLALTLSKGDGAYTFTVRATDAAGNTDPEPASYAWTLDTSLPSSVITSPLNGTVVNNLTAISGTAADNQALKLVQVSIKDLATNTWFNGTTFAATSETFLDVTGTSSWTYKAPGWASGRKYLIRSKAMDTAGNVETPIAGNTFTYDVDAPGSIVTSPANGAVLSALSSVTGKASDSSGIGKVEVSIKDASTNTWFSGSSFAAGSETWLVATGTVNWSFVPPAWTNGRSYLIRSRAMDVTGNVETPGLGNTFKFDTGAPDTVIESKPPNPSNSASPSFGFTGTDPEGSALTFRCQIDGGDFIVCTSPKSFASLTNGSHTFAVKSADAAGNADPTPATYTWTIDTIAPETTIGTKPPAVSNQATASFSFTCSDSVGAGLPAQTTCTFTCKLDQPLTPGAFAPCASPLPLSLAAPSSTGSKGDGSYTFSARAIDPAGNVDPTPASYTWMIDTTPPDTTIMARPSTLSNKKDACFSFLSTEDQSTFECKLDTGGFEACNSAKCYLGLSDGQHTFSVRATDPAGNSDPTPGGYTWSIDTLPPDTAITAKPPNPTNKADASFSFSSTEAGSTFQCRLDDGAYDVCASPRTYAVLPDGIHTFYVRATDTTGNVDPLPAAHTWAIDTLPPDTAITAKPPNPTNKADASFSFSSTEAGSTFQCRLDAGANGACAVPAVYKGLPDGTHTLYVRAVDQAGNTDLAPAAYAWRIDTTVPDTLITERPPNPTNKADASFSFSSTEAGSTFQCRLDGGSYSPCTSSKTYAGVTDGNHTFYVQVTDEAGNTDLSPASYTWAVDTTAPETTIMSKPSNPSGSTTAVFFFTSPDGSATFECKLDGGAWGLCTSPHTLSSLAGGDHTFQVRAKDAAGNADLTPASHPWQVDLTPPQSQISSPPSGSTLQTLASVTGTASDNLQVHSVEISTKDTATNKWYDGTTFAAAAETWLAAAGTTSWSYKAPVWANGVTYQIRSRASDTAGNTETPTQGSTFKYLVDSQPPTFAGLASAKTISETEIELSWNAASDNLTPSSKIVYLICQTNTSGSCIAHFFANYATPPGVTTYKVTGLKQNSVYYFVVRAKDEAGNESTNVVEKSARMMSASIVKAIATGFVHTCSLISDGRVMCWGRNGEGQLGNGATSTSSSVPASVSGLSGTVAIDAGMHHTCAVGSDGSVRCWGYNEYGQLGDGTNSNRNVPVTVTTLTNSAVAIATGLFDTCALQADGSAKCWGNNYGTIPVAVSGLSGVISLTSGATHTCALVANGGAMCWGSNNDGQLGDGTGMSSMTTPVPVANLSGVVVVATGWNHTCALLFDGRVACWGSNSHGQLGNGTYTKSLTPLVVPAITGARAVSAGGHHTCVVISDGTSRCWGGNDDGQLGDGTTTARPTPVSVSGLTAAVTVATGFAYTCSLISDGTVKCWGSNVKGQLGNGTYASSLVPMVVSGITGVARPVALTAGGNSHTCALVSDGTVNCWGYNSFGQLGNGTTINSTTPVTVSSLARVFRIEAGGNHSCAVVSDGTAKCWGYNGSGQVGDGSLVNKASPVAVLGLTGAVAITGGEGHTCALVSDGTVKCWGKNDNGQLGDGTIAQRTTPVTVAGLSGAVRVTAGGEHTCALISDGTVKCWGDNVYGELGNGTLVDSSTAAKVSNLAGVVEISAAGSHTCALLFDGTAKCWGFGYFGELGNGVSGGSNYKVYPVPVVNLAGAKGISGGHGSTCATMFDGMVKCWGNNAYGQLGNGTTTDSSSPLGVPALTGVAEVSTGGIHACALVSDGRIQCWGMNDTGQLGDGTMVGKSTPVSVVGLGISAGAAEALRHFAPGVKPWLWAGGGGSILALLAALLYLRRRAAQARNLEQFAARVDSAREQAAKHATPGAMVAFRFERPLTDGTETSTRAGTLLREVLKNRKILARDAFMAGSEAFVLLSHSDAESATHSAQGVVREWNRERSKAGIGPVVAGHAAKDLSKSSDGTLEILTELSKEAKKRFDQMMEANILSDPDRATAVERDEAATIAETEKEKKRQTRKGSNE